MLANDSDPDDDTLSVVSFSSPASGSVTQAGNVLIYEPFQGFVGEDSFNYTISDELVSATARVAITVTASPNRAPVATDDDVTVTSGESVSIDVLNNDTDPDGDPLTITSFTNPANGSVSQDENVLTYISSPGFVGGDVFSYTVSDGQEAVTAVVSVTVKGISAGVYTNNQPYNIPDNRGYGVQSPIQVDIAGYREGITVYATIRHARVSDLRIQLVSPDGRRFNLPADQVGGTETQWYIALPKHLDIGGEWRLEVSDQKKSIVGVLEKWGLRFE